MSTNPIPMAIPARKDIMGQRLKRTPDGGGEPEYGICMDCIFIESSDVRQHAGWRLLLRTPENQFVTWVAPDESNRSHGWKVEFMPLDVSPEEANEVMTGGLFSYLQKQGNS